MEQSIRNTNLSLPFTSLRLSVAPIWYEYAHQRKSKSFNVAYKTLSEKEYCGSKREWNPETKQNRNKTRKSDGKLGLWYKNRTLKCQNNPTKFSRNPEIHIFICIFTFSWVKKKKLDSTWCVWQETAKVLVTICESRWSWLWSPDGRQQTDSS